MTDRNPEHQAPLASTLPTAAQRLPWLERVSRYRQPITLAVTLALFAMALIACRHLLSELDIHALHDAMLSVPTRSLAGALLAAVIGFVILLGYEWSACRYAAVKLPGRTLLLGGFSAFAIGNAIGLSMLSGGSVRYRLYAREGLGAAEVARMTVFASLSLGCALPPLAALATLSNLPAAATALHLPTPVLATVAIGVLALTALLVTGLYRRRLAEQPLPDSLLVQLGRRTLQSPRWI
jgi:phosphatidylglycerol lysyltransferase